MPPSRRSLSALAPTPVAPAEPERKPKRSFFSSANLPFALQPSPVTPVATLKPSAAVLATFAPAPDFVQPALTPLKDNALERTVTPAPGVRLRIKEVSSIRAARRSVAAAETGRGASSPAASGDKGVRDPIPVENAAGRAVRASTRKDSQPTSTISPSDTVSPPKSDIPPDPNPVASIAVTGPAKPKEYLHAGFYCQHADISPSPLITAALAKKPKGRGKAVLGSSFPPLPIEYGAITFFERENDFVLPYDIATEYEHGKLGGKKVPEKYTKLRGNVFPERPKRIAPEAMICHCDPESECRVQCINRAMSYFCGKDCPSGDKCSNKSLIKRTGKNTKVYWTGSRGFGLVAAEPIREGDFVIDYRGEVISLSLFYERIRKEYKDKRNFYALAYDGDEVIDSGMRGNDSRYINHGCDPNLEVRKYTTMGDGIEEYEVGFWANRDIAEGEELMYDYNFDSFSTIKRDAVHPDFVSPNEERRTQCNCGSTICVGYLGKKSGEKSANLPETSVAVETFQPAARDSEVQVAGAKVGAKAKSKLLLKLPPNLKKGKLKRKGVVTQAGAAHHKDDEPWTAKTRSKTVGRPKQAATGSKLKLAADSIVKVKKTRKHGLLRVAKMAIIKPSGAQDEAIRILSMTDRDWELERKRLKKGHEWKAQQIAAARALAPTLEIVLPDKVVKMSRKEKETKARANEKIPKATPGVLLDPSRPFRPAKWSSIKTQPVVLSSPDKSGAPPSLKSRVSMSALVTTPSRRAGRSSMSLSEDLTRPAALKANPSKATQNKSSTTQSTSAKAVTTKTAQAKTTPVRSMQTKAISSSAVAEEAQSPAPVEEARVIRKRSSTSRASSSKVPYKPLTTTVPAVPYPAPHASSSWAPNSSGPKLKFKFPAHLRPEPQSSLPPLPSAMVMLPPSNISSVPKLPQELISVVEARIDRRRKALEAERFSQGKGSSWFQSELGRVNDDEYGRAWAFVRQQRELTNAQRKLAEMTAEFTGGPVQAIPEPSINLNAFVAPPLNPIGKKRSEWEYHTRKKPGSIHKSALEWEEERRSRKKGHEWLRVMKEIHGVAGPASPNLRQSGSHHTPLPDASRHHENTLRPLDFSRGGHGKGKEKARSNNPAAPSSPYDNHYSSWTEASDTASESAYQTRKRKSHAAEADARKRMSYEVDSPDDTWGWGEADWEEGRRATRRASAHYTH